MHDEVTIVKSIITNLAISVIRGWCYLSKLGTLQIGSIIIIIIIFQIFYSSEPPTVTQEPGMTRRGSTATFECIGRFGGPSKSSIGDLHYPEMAMYLGDTKLEGNLTETAPHGHVVYYTFRMVNKIVLAVYRLIMA